MQDQATPLHIAAHNGHLEVVKLLMAHKADVNVMDKVVMYIIKIVVIINFSISYSDYTTN